MTNFEKLCQNPGEMAKMISPYRIEELVCGPCASKRAHCWEDCEKCKAESWLNQEADN